MMEHHLRLVYKKTAASVLGALSHLLVLSLSLFFPPSTGAQPIYKEVQAIL